jgi:hypothetical protein
MLERANRVLPEGLRLTGWTRLPEGSPSLGKAVAASRFRLRRLPDGPPWPPRPELPGVLDWVVNGDDLVVTVNARQVDGPTPGPRELLAVAGVAEERLRLVSVVREALVLAERAAVAG